MSKTIAQARAYYEQFGCAGVVSLMDALMRPANKHLNRVGTNSAGIKVGAMPDMRRIEFGGFGKDDPSPLESIAAKAEGLACAREVREHLDRTCADLATMLKNGKRLPGDITYIRDGFFNRVRR